MSSLKQVMHANLNHRSSQLGFSLIELVIFIVILAISLTAISLLYITTTRHGSDPLIKIKSIELAQSTLDEIMLKAYDEDTPTGGGCVRYPVQGNTLCTGGAYAGQPTAFNETALLAEADDGGPATDANPTIRGQFDDVDDYNDLAYCGTGGVQDPSCTATCIELVDESGSSIADQYPGFAVCIQVSFAGGGTEINTFTGPNELTVPLNDAKRIDVIVTDPVHSRISLTAYRLNF